MTMDHHLPLRVLCVLFLVELLLIQSGLSAETILTLTSPTDHLRQGSTVLLTCTVVNLDQDFFSGEEQHIRIVRRNQGEDYQDLATWTPSASTVSEPGRFEITGLRKPDLTAVVQFQISDVTSEDASSYQCAAYDRTGWWKGSNRHTLEMMTPPSSKFPVCEVSWGGERKVSLKMDCYAERSVPPPKLVWFENGNEVSDRIIFRDYLYYENVLYVNSTSLDSEYTCRFYYSDGDIVDQRSCFVNKPKLKFHPEIPSFVLGGSTRLIVFVQASPALRKPIACFRNYWDEYSSHWERLDIDLQGNDYGEITVRHVDSAWNGSQVSCSAENMVGRSTRNFTVLVEDHDRASGAEVYMLPEDPTVSEGDSVTFVCVRSDELKDFEIQWFFAGRKISKKDANDRYLISNGGQEMKLAYTTLSDDVQVLSCQIEIDNGVFLEASTDIRVHSALHNIPLSQRFSIYWCQSKALVLVVTVLSVLGMIFIVVLLLKCACRLYRLKYPHIAGYPNVKCRIDSSSSKGYLMKEEGLPFGPTAMQASIAADRPASVLTLNRSLPEVPLVRLHSVSEVKKEPKPPPPQPPEVSYVDMHSSSEDGSIPPPSYYSATLPVPEKIEPEHVSHMKKNFQPARRRERHPSGHVPPDSMEPIPLPVQFQDGDDVFCDPYQELEDLYRDRAESNAYIGKK